MSRRRYRGLRKGRRRPSHVIVVKIDGGFIQSLDCLPIRTIEEVDLHGFDIDEGEKSGDCLSFRASASMTKAAKWLFIRLARNALREYREYSGKRYEVVSILKNAVTFRADYYLTFTAAEKAKYDGDVVKTKTFQAIISHDRPGVPIEDCSFINFIRIIPST